MSNHGSGDHAPGRGGRHAWLAVLNICCIAVLTPEAPESDLTRGNFVLPNPLPTARLEVAHPTSWADLVVGLKALGFKIVVGREAAAAGPVVRITDGSFAPTDERTAFVVIARARSVQALTAAIEAGASGYFVAPIDYLSLSATICAAAAQARDLTTLSERTAKLSESLTADQTVSTVVGILMERYRFQRSEAYERLRRYSRTERRKVVEVATEIVTATEELGKTMRAIESVPRET